MKMLPCKRLAAATLFSGFLMLGFTACESEADDSKEIAKDQNEATFEDRDVEKDADRLVNAADILQKNIKLGELASSKATSQEVKDLGSKIAKSHAGDLAELQTLASGKSISLPASTTENTKDAYEDLNDKTGMDFDKKYCNKVISSHKDAIDKMESIEKNAEDADIRAWATKMLPHLRSHLTSAEAIENKVKDKN